MRLRVNLRRKVSLDCRHPALYVATSPEFCRAFEPRMSQMLERENKSRAAEERCSPATRLAGWRRLERALLRTVGAALLMALVPLQGHAQNAARLDESAAHCRPSRLGDQHPQNRQGPFAPPPSGLLTCAGDLDGTAQQEGANAEQRSVSTTLAYVLSPPPATRGVLPRYLPRISPQDAKPIPSLATTTTRRPAWRQGGHVRHAHGHQCRQRHGARRHLAELPRRCRVQRAVSCRHDRSARGLRFHHHRLCPKRCAGHRHGAMARGCR